MEKDRHDIIRELEDVINNNSLINRADDWLHDITKDNVFCNNLFLSLKLIYSAYNIIKEERRSEFFLPEKNIRQKRLEFVNYKNEENQEPCAKYKIVVTKNNVLLKYSLNDNDVSETTIEKNPFEEFNVTECGINLKGDVAARLLIENRNDYDYLVKLNGDFNDTKNKNTILHIVEFLNINFLTQLVYTILFSKAFEIVCYSVLSGEYAMDDSFSKRIRRMSKTLQKSFSRDALQGSSFNFFSQCAVALSQILDAYNLFCIQTDAQVDKDPSSVLGDTAEYYGYHQYEEYLNKFLSDYGDIDDFSERGGFLYVNPLLVHFFQTFLEMTRIDQNFFFSKDRLYNLLYFRELLDDSTQGKGIWQIWNKYQKEVDFLDLKFTYVHDVLHLIKLKNEFLIKKILGSCHNEVRDLTYVGQSNIIVFDPRKCHDIEKDNAELLLFNETKGNETIDKEIENILDLYTNFLHGLKGKFDTIFDEYERDYNKATHANSESEEASGLHKYYDEVVMSRTIGISKDIRHYNTKVIEMARDAIFDTAEIRCWIKYHRHDFNEKNGFVQIKKVLLFLQERYEGVNVCCDNEMLVGYTGWCLDFLEIVVKKSPSPNSNRPSQIEDALLLLEILNRLLDKLIKSIKEKNYCLPYSSKFRGCFFIYNKNIKKQQDENQLYGVLTFNYGNGESGGIQDGNRQDGLLERVFTGMPKCDDDRFEKKNFGDFVAAKKEYYEDRRSIIFIASSYVPPLNYEKLKEESRSFVARTLKLRNEIHAEYFNRLREYIKEDSEKQLENNRRSVVQILGIFAAFLALTTVALSAANSESDLPFVTIMVGFTTCIVVFVALLYLLTHSKVQREYEVQRYQDKIFKQNVNKEILRFIHVVKNTISDVDNETERGVTKKVNAILDKETTNIKMQEDCLCKRSDFEERVEQIENKLDRIKHFKRGRYYLAKSWKIHPAEWIIIILLVVMTALTILLSINNEGKNNMSTVQIVTKLEAKSKDGKTKDNADITNNDKNHGNKNITEEGQNMEKEAESQKIISEQDPILDGGKKRVKEPVPEK